MANLKELDPVQGLVDYVLDIKPYHTKIMEVLIEYVHTDIVDVTILDDHEMEIELVRPPDTIEFVCEEDGYDTGEWGSGYRFSITSPNVSIAFEDYPAINAGTNSVIITGNQTKDFKVGDTVYISTFVDDYTNVYKIANVVSGPAGSASFIIKEGTIPPEFLTPGYTFRAYEAGDNNGTYSVALGSPGPTTDGTYTTIPVQQSIPSSTAAGSIGLVTTPGTNNGYFTVLSVEFDGGSIDSWPDVTDPSTYTLGDDPHTIIRFEESLNAPAFPGSPALEQVHVAYLLPEPIPIESSLAYSRANKIYSSASPIGVTQEPDEGTNRTAIVGVDLSGGGSPIDGAFIVEGDFSGSNLFVGDDLKVDTSTGNNGTYTITDISYDALNDQTTFRVSETVNDATVDGYVSVFIPSNAFVVDGDRTNQFTQGRQFDVQGGVFTGTFTVLASRYSQDKTYIRVHEDIFNLGTGDAIVAIDGGFVVTGNLASKYPVGTTFNVVGSESNDGVYTVVGSPGATYDAGTGRTTIPVAETLDSTPGGELFLALVSNLRRTVYGYDESSPICGVVPETVVAVYMTENLEFSGLGLDLHDDLIAYNLENTDRGGYDLPINTIISATIPSITESGTEPVVGGSPSESYQHLWFDTSLATPVLKQYVRYGWEPIAKAYWFDSVNNLLYYRTKSNNVDTGWILDSLRIPGYSDQMAAIGEKQIIAQEEFFAGEISPGVPETTFTLTTAVPSEGSPAFYDTSLIRVYVNDVPAGFTLDSNTQFTVTSPAVLTGDVIRAVIYDRNAMEGYGSPAIVGPGLNAHVKEFDVIPHQVFHSGVGVDTTNNAYVVSGGNYIDRFVSFNTVTGYNTNDAGSPAQHDIVAGTWNATSFPIFEVDGVANTFTIYGDYTWLFTAGRVLRVNPGENNFFDFTVVSSTLDYVGSPATQQLTVITVSETVTQTGIEISGSPFAGSPIPVTNESYSRDLGVIVGSVYDPAVSGTGVYDTNQPKTIFVPTTTVDPIVDAFSYLWVGPVRFDIGLSPSDLASASINDGLGISDELLGVPDRFTILDTNTSDGSPSSPDTFTIHYDDAVLGPVDLGQVLSPGTIFKVAGSYSNGQPSTMETNDAMYVVKSTFFDLAGSPTSGTGDTIITVETDFDQMPPYGEFTVVEVSNNLPGSPSSGSPTSDAFNTLTLSGNHVNLLNTFAINGIAKFRLDVPLVSADSLYNIITVSNIELVGGNTVLTVQEEFLDETYTGALGMIDAKYRAEIYWDENNVSGSPNEFIHGTILREAFVVGQRPVNTASAQFIDELLFGWGDVLRWPIVGVNATGSPNGSYVHLYGDYTAIILPNDRAEIKGAAGAGGSPVYTINGNYEIESVSYDVGTGLSTVKLANPDITVDPPIVNINVTILSTGAGSPSTRTFVIDGEDGLHVDFLRPGTTFTVEDGIGSPNSTPNAGTYTVVTAVHDSTTDTITITTVEDIPSDSAAGYVQYTKKDAGFLEMENIDISPWFQYTIKEIRPISSDIILNGNAAGDVQTGQQVRALGTLANDSIFTAANAPTFNALTNTTTLPVAEPLNYGENPIAEIIGTNLLKVLGSAANYLGVSHGGSPNVPWGGAGSPPGSIGGGSPNVGDTVFITGSTGNDGTYTVLGATYDGIYSYITLTTDLPDTTPDGTLQFRDKGGWIEALRYQGIALRFTDTIAVSTAEEADAAVLLTSGSLIGSWDYPLWDVASFDENVETVIHLYSNTF